MSTNTMDLPTALQVTLHSGHNLYDTNFLCKMDPYVEVRVGGTSLKSAPHDRGGRNPQWEQTLTFTYNNEEFIEFKVYDKDIFADDYVGISTFNVRALAESPERTHNVNVPLTRKKGKSAGTLKVTLRFFGSVAASGKVGGGSGASPAGKVADQSSTSPQSGTVPVQVVVNTPYGPSSYPAQGAPASGGYYAQPPPAGAGPYGQQGFPAPGGYGGTPQPHLAPSYGMVPPHLHHQHHHHPPPQQQQQQQQQYPAHQYAYPPHMQPPMAYPPPQGMAPPPFAQPHPYSPGGPQQPQQPFYRAPYPQ